MPYINYAVNISNFGSIVLNGGGRDWRIRNWKERERKQPWRNYMHCPEGT